MSKSKSSHARRLRRIGYATGAATALVLAGSSVPAYAQADMVVSPGVGPTGGGNTITLTTTTTNANEQFVEGASFVTFQWNDPVDGADRCSATYPSSVAIAETTGVVSAGTVLVPSQNVRVFSKNKLLVTVPAALALPQAATTRSAPFHVCVYSANSGSTLIARTGASHTTASYRIADVATVTSVTPATGPAQGGDTITIVGTNLTGATAAIDGIPLTNVVIGGGGTTLTGTAPAHSAGGPFALTITSAGGNRTTHSAAYTYTNGIRITPNTAPNTKMTATDVDVTGVGFLGMDWTGTAGGGTPNSPTAHVYLVKGGYDPTSAGPATYLSAPKANGQVAECQDVIVIDDTELICSLWTAGNGVRQLRGQASRVVTNASVATAGATITITNTSNGNVFTANDIGAVVTGISGATATGAHITAVTSPSTATLNKAPAPTNAYTGSVTLYPSRTVTDAARTATSTTVTSSGNNFQTYDVGRVVTGTGIPAGTTISAVANTGSVTLSAAPTATTTGPLQVGPPVTNTAIPNGTYTMTVVNNGASDVQPGGTRAAAGYQQSIISSGSTFTVADY